MPRNDRDRDRRGYTLNPTLARTTDRSRSSVQAVTFVGMRTKNLRAVQLLLGHSKLESTVRYLGIEVDDDLEISEQIEI